MPLYVYKCEDCGHEFDDLVSYNKRDDVKACKVCGKSSKRVEVTTFGFSVEADRGATLTSPKEIDKAVGVDAEKRWNHIEDRRNKRWKGFQKMDISVPKVKDGSYRPVEVLGDQKEKGLRKQYSEALAEHRAERLKKGEGQFDGRGAIQE